MVPGLQAVAEKYFTPLGKTDEVMISIFYSKIRRHRLWKSRVFRNAILRTEREFGGLFGEVDQVKPELIDGIRGPKL